MSSQISILNGLPSYKEAFTAFEEMAAKFNSEAFAPYKDAFRGKKVVLLGDGPTANIFRGIDDAIYIGVNNGIRRHNIELDYYFTSDCFDNILLNNEYRLAKKCFCAINTHTMVHYTPDKFLNDFTKKVYYFPTTHGNDYTFPKDITKGFLHMDPSIIFLAVAFALFGNPKKLFLVGCDCGDFRTTNISLAYKKRASVHNAMIDNWKYVKDFACKYKPDTEIISINPCNLSGMFHDIILDREALDALKYRDNDKFEEAFEHVLKALQEDPSNHSLLSLAADIMEKSANYERFEMLMKNWLESHPEWADGYVRMANYWKDRGDEAMAIHWSQQAYSLYPASLEARLGYAHLLRFYKRGIELDSLLQEIDSPAFNAVFGNSIYLQLLANICSFEERIQGCKEALKYFPNNLDIYFHLEWAYANCGDIASAKAVCIEALNEFPENPLPAYHRLINYALTQDNLQMAVHYARKLWEKGGWWHSSWIQICEILLRMQRSDEAHALLDEISSVYSDIPILQFYYGKVYNSQNRLPEAMEALQKEVSRLSGKRGTYLTAIDLYSTILIQNGQWEEALEILLKELEANYELHDRWLSISKYYFQYGDDDLALQTAQKALELAPDSIVIKNYISSVYQRQKRFNEAIAIIREQLASFPNWSAGWIRLAELIEARKGDEWQQESIDYAAKAIEVDPENMRSANAFINRLQRLSKNLAAIECEKILRRLPDWKNGYILLFHIAMALKQYDDALKYARTAQRLDPDDHEALTAVTTALLHKKQLDLALQECSSFLEIHPDDAISMRQKAYIMNAFKKPLQYFTYLYTACTLDPRQSDRLYKPLLEWLHTQKDYIAEKNILREALSFNKQWGWGWTRFAALTKDPVEKAEIYKEAIKYNRNWAHAYYQLSLLSQQPDASLAAPS